MSAVAPMFQALPDSAHAANSADPAAANSINSSPRVSNEYVCPVCHFKSNDKHCFHYGGVCCYSCRAFFRRAHQGTKSPVFKCKKGNDCEISVKTRRKCQKCRYDLCLKSGMDPELVLSEDQKKIRFRNYLKKKSANSFAQETGGDSSSSSGVDPIQDDEEYQHIERPIEQTRHNRSAHIFGSYSNEASCLPVLAIMNQIHRTNNQNQQQQKFAQERQYFNSLRVHATVLQPRSSIVERLDHYDQRLPKYPKHPASQLIDQAYSDHAIPTKRARLSIPEENLIRYHEERTHEQPPMMRMSTYATSSSSGSYEGGRDPSPSDSIFSATPPTTTTEEPDEEESNHESWPDDHLDSKDHRMELIQQNYFLAMAHMDTTPRFIDCLQSFHSGKPTNMDRAEFSGHLFRLAGHFKQFASEQSTFRRLTSRDQLCLLERNTALFLMYVLGRYLGASTGEEQLKWLLDENMPQNLSYSKLDCVSFRRLNQHLQLFREDQAGVILSSSFEGLARQVVDTGLAYHCTGLVAHMLLFNSDMHMELEQPTRINANFIEALELLKHAHTHLGVRLHIEPILKMIKQLDAMHDIYNKSIKACTQPNLPFLSIALPYTKDEEAWTGRELAGFQESWESVSMPEHLMKSILEHSLRASASVNLLPGIVQLFLARLRKAALDEPKFKVLSEASQNKIWGWNCLACLTLCLARLERANSGHEQMRILMGSPARESRWEEDVPRVDPRRLGRVSLAEMDAGWGRLSREDLAEFSGDAEGIVSGGVVRDDDDFRLLLKAQLFNGEAGFLNSTVSHVQEYYVKLLERRINSVDGGDSAYVKVKEAMALAEKVSFVVTKIES